MKQQIDKPMIKVKFKNFMVLAVMTTLFSCKKEPTICPPLPQEKYYRAEFMQVTTQSNDCGLVLAIDTNNNGVTEIGGHVTNLDSVYHAHDTIWIQYKLLLDSFYCHIYGGTVGGNFNPVFPSIEITKIRE